MLVLLALIAAPTASAQSDPYENYLRTSKDFQPVKQDPSTLLKAWPTFTYMPWSYQWHIGYSDASAKWSLENGYNGAFIDHGQGGAKLAWIDKHSLRFYVDHTAGKGYLHLWDGNAMKPHADKVHGTGVRIKPVNEAMANTLRPIIRKYIENVKASPNRAAYALDDEISWGHFVHPTMWQVTDDKTAYSNWLKEIYGPANAPRRDGWISYNDILPRLKTWSIATFDASPLMDQWTFNDAWWCNFLGDLVTYANSIDADTPCGFVGGQSPNAFGGYDYARLMRKVQFIESYNIGSSQAIIRSFNPANAIPAVTTHFHKQVDDTVWQAWYYLARGNKGFIGWVENWFEKDGTPKPWHAQVAPALLEVEKLSKLMTGARWQHDGVAVYYSHPSIQLSWIFDAQAHGKTWVNRNNDHRLGTSHLVRKAWENMLRDSDLQYSFISYVDVVRDGIPMGSGFGVQGSGKTGTAPRTPGSERSDDPGTAQDSALRTQDSLTTNHQLPTINSYSTLVLPAVFCLSDAEARRIRAFVEQGGTVIADFLPGLWDQHGRGRKAGGALDDLFGVKHDPAIAAKDLFNGSPNLWVEVDQDANFSYKTYDQFLTNKSACIKHESGYHKAVRNMEVMKVNRVGKGVAILMNLSPQWYNAYRIAGASVAAAKRDVFMRHVPVQPKIRLKPGADDAFGHEITRWTTPGGRTLVYVTSNPEIAGSQLGGGNSVGLRTATVPITLQFAAPLTNVRDERTGKSLPNGVEFPFTWTLNQAVLLSHDSQGNRM